MANELRIEVEQVKQRVKTRLSSIRISSVSKN
jgi:hypothetical protein